MDPRAKRKQREQEARRQEILASAETLFSRNGFFKTSMADIATAAQFAMGTLYRFFKSKEDIYISIVEVKVERLAELLEAELGKVSTVTEKIHAFIRVKLDYADRHRDFFRIYVSEWNGFEWTVKSALGERVWKVYSAQVELVANLVREGIRRKEFRKVDPKDAAFALHGMLNSTMYMWILETNPKGLLKEKEKLIGELFLNGIEKSSQTNSLRRVV